ncbi:hypothetical protein TPSD3_14175 [Thioflexithrix psekupsensis]|uniref:Uncharacterized protein n=2 Tax=Thioflexithrix psekupsensis TaxID=1570016 RepID=A0A251X4D6_9GAMM|nr:hypothetical protein [Thioflexithrix psekupsensis]OUD12260.1 hypothetical protein TPSD3_14175 [Thioflexithrix psekupsensis]
MKVVIPPKKNRKEPRPFDKFNSAKAELRDQVEAEVRNELKNKIKDELKAEVKAEVKAEIRDQVKAEGIQEQIATLYSLHQEGILPQAKLNERLAPLIKQLNELKKH